MTHIAPLSVVVVVATAALLLLTSAASAEVPLALNNAEITNLTWQLWEIGRNSSLVVLPYSVPGPSNSSMVATVIYNESLPDQGWDFLQAGPSSASSNYNPYYLTGYGEGYITQARIAQVYAQGNFTMTPQQTEWITNHTAYMTNQSLLGENGANGTFWTQVGNLLAQMQGIADGYTTRAEELKLPGLTFLDIFLLNFQNEFGDVKVAVSSNEDGVSSIDRHHKQKSSSRRNQHCSALIKVTDTDLFFSHDTWDDYVNTIRMYKVYTMNEATVAFSAMAGLIASGDDWYITSNQLAVMETTIGNFNDTITRLYVTPQTVSEFLRVMVATYMSTTGQQWTQLFAFNNSGTYCNQYMVVNYNLYQTGDNGTNLADGLLWVAEQIPGLVVAQDLTVYLANFSYWGSYNVPFFPEIYVQSGYQLQYDAWGTFFSWSETPRALIFDRNNSDVVDMESMKALMRYNNWQHDVLSTIPNCTKNCTPTLSPMLAIASRGDLVPSTALLPNNSYGGYFGFGAFGAVDCKITSYNLIQTMTGVVISGPTTYNNQPVFSWTGNFSTERPNGAPFQYDFPWQKYYQIMPPHGYYGGLVETKYIIIGVVCGTVGLFVIAAIAVVIIRRHRRGAKDDDYEPLLE